MAYVHDATAQTRKHLAAAILKAIPSPGSRISHRRSRPCSRPCSQRVLFDALACVRLLQAKDCKGPVTRTFDAASAVLQAFQRSDTPARHRPLFRPSITEQAVKP